MDVKKYEWYAEMHKVFRAENGECVRSFSTPFEAQRAVEFHNREIEEIAAELAAESFGRFESGLQFSDTVECVAKMVPLDQCSFRPGDILAESAVELAAKIHGVSALSVAFAVSERRVKLLQEWLKERGRG